MSKTIRHKHKIINDGLSLNEIACILTQICMEYSNHYSDAHYKGLKEIGANSDEIYFEITEVLE